MSRRWEPVPEVPDAEAPERTLPAMANPTQTITADERRVRRGRRAAAVVADQVRRRGGTITIVASIVVVSVLGTTTRFHIALGSFDVRGMFLSMLRVDEPWALFAVVLATLAVGGLAEGAMGTRRLLAAFFGGGFVVCALGRAFAAFEEIVIPAVPLNAPPAAGAPPLAALLCTAMAASCFASALWRRRIRLAGVVFAVTLFLYAASASDMYALVALPIGVGVGLLLGGTRAAGVLRSSFREKRVLLAALTTIVAVGPVVATIWGSGAGLLSVYGWLSYDPLALSNGVVCVIGSANAPCPAPVADYTELQPIAGWIAALPQLVLLVAAWGILRGRRSALYVGLAVNLLTFVAMSTLVVINETDTLEALASARGTFEVVDVWQTVVGMAVGAVVPLLVAALLFRFRSAVQIRTSPRIRAVFFRAVALSASGALLLAFVGTLLTSGAFRPSATVADVVATLPLRLVPPSLLPPELISFVPETAAAQAAWYLPALLFWLGAVVATFHLVSRSRADAAAPDRERARALLTAGSADTLGHMTLWAGNAYWFAADARAAIAYRVRGRIAVTLGGPFGPDRSAPHLGRAFAAFCEEHGWTPVFYSVGESDRQRLEPLGWHSVQVAEEACLDPTTWTPAGKKRQDVRTATNRAEREGVSSEWTRWADLAFLDRGQIRDISEGWVADKTIPEMEFTLGSTDQMDDPAVRLLVARDASGRITAFTSWIPIQREGEIAGYALDVMRRHSDAMPGVMEFLIGQAVDRLREAGMTVMSLSGSPLARQATPEPRERSSLDRGLDMISALLEPAYGFRSLASFKKKFQPQFTPLWMIYPDAVQIPAIAIAIIRCYIPGLTIRSAAELAGSLRRVGEPVPA